MAGRTTWPPKVRTHGGIDYLRVQIDGERRKWTLGPSGSDESRAEYLRVVGELEAGRLLGARTPSDAVTVGDVILPFLERCRAETSRENYLRAKAALAPVGERYGLKPADSFGPLALEAVRETYVAAGYCRDVCNAMASVVRQAFRWAAGREIVPHTIHERLATLGPLVEGRTAAPDFEEVGTVPDDHVARTLPQLCATLSDMVRLQLLLGCRPGELVLIRAAEIVRPWKSFDGVGVWLYKLTRHKTRWKGGKRAIAVGPKAQAILGPYLDSRAADACCFSPAEAAVKRVAARHGGAPFRGQSAESPRWRLGDRYTTDSYGQAIERAAARAGVPHWTPNQLRHNAGTRVEADHGREDARSVLGHKNASTTSIYADMAERAGRIAAKDG